MPYTLGELKRQVLFALHRTADSDTFEQEDLTRAINSARHRAWLQSYGGTPDTVYLDIVEGKRDYSLDIAASGPTGVAFVSVKPDAASPPVRLDRYSVEDLVDGALGYPEVNAGIPKAFVFRVRTRAVPRVPDDAPVFNPLESSRFIVSLYPVPNYSLDNGLLVETIDPTMLLADDADVSELMETVDEFAVSLAAEMLAPFIIDEPATQAALPLIAESQRKGLRDARREANGYGNKPFKLRPSARIGRSRSRMPKVDVWDAIASSPTTATVYERTGHPTGGSSYVLIDVNDHPVTTGYWGEVTARVGPFDLDATVEDGGRTVRVSALADCTFEDGDLVPITWRSDH